MVHTNWSQLNVVNYFYLFHWNNPNYGGVLINWILGLYEKLLYELLCPVLSHSLMSVTNILVWPLRFAYKILIQTKKLQCFGTSFDFTLIKLRCFSLFCFLIHLLVWYLWPKSSRLLPLFSVQISWHRYEDYFNFTLCLYHFTLPPNNLIFNLSLSHIHSWRLNIYWVKN